MKRILDSNVMDFLSEEPSRLERSTKCRLNRYLSSLFPGDGFVGKPVGKDRTIRDLLSKYEKVQGIVASVEADAKIAGFNGPYQPGGCHEKNIAAYQGEHKDPFTWNQNFRRAKTAIMEMTKPKVPLTVRHWQTDQEVLDDLPKKETHAGFEYLVTGKRKKGEYAEGILAALRQKEFQATSDGIYNIPHIIGPRYQWRGAYDDETGQPVDWKVKPRTIWIEDIFLILTELRFSIQAQWWFGQLDCYAGGKKPQELWQILTQLQSKYLEWVSLDYSKYDQSIPGWLISEAFDVIRSWFGPLDAKDESLWLVVVNTFIHKGVVGPQGQMVYVDDGVPSGSMFTQLIDSIVNLLMVQTYYFAMGHDSYIPANVCGDDNIVFHDGWIDLSNLSTYLQHNFGIQMSPDKCMFGRQSDNMRYLSRVFTKTGVYRHPKTLIAHMLFPEHFRDYRREEISPELIIFAYYLAYPEGMSEAFDMNSFFHDYGNLEIRDDSRALDSLPGFLRYQIRYEGLKLNRPMLA